MRVGQPSILLFHDDSDLLDRLTTRFEAEGWMVAIAATRFGAIAQFNRRQPSDDFTVVVASWDVAQSTYAWVVDNRPHLRNRFIFLGSVSPDELRGAARECVLLPAEDEEAIVAQARELAGWRPPEAIDPQFEQLVVFDDEETDTPALLLIEDDPHQLSFMARFLEQEGFQVTAADSGTSARELLALDAQAHFDVVLCDWFMVDGTGGDLFQWLADHRPELARRCVFMSGAAVREFAELAPGCTLVPKGQDSGDLLRVLRALIR
jgi:CheY-like chemotaxis protein